jgi:putative cardiolipin synthase
MIDKNISVSTNGWVNWVAIALSAALAACTSIPSPQVPRKISHAIPPSMDNFAKALTNDDAKSDESGFRMLEEGIDGLAARLEIIDRAQQSLDLQYYIFHCDDSGLLIVQALLRAADRGVRVRILVDDGEAVAGDEKLFALAAHRSIEVRVFNPFDYRGHMAIVRALDFALHKRRLDHRMHNKMLIADSSIVLIGGRNIGNQYFQVSPDSQFGDDDVMTYGPIVEELSGVFDLFWNSTQAVSITALDAAHSSPDALVELRKTTAGLLRLKNAQEELDARLLQGAPLSGVLSTHDSLVWAHVEALYDSPDKATTDAGHSREQVYPALSKRAAALSRELLMISPYLVPSRAEMKMLQQARQRGVRVAYLTNSLEAAPDVVAHAGYTHSRKILIEEGVEAYEVRAQPEGSRGTGQKRSMSQHGHFGLHAKLYGFDRQSLFVGSLNFDQRSRHINTEIGLLIDSPALAQIASQRFDALVSLTNAYTVQESAQERDRLTWRTNAKGQVVELTSEPARNVWQWLASHLFALLPLEREL